MTRCSPGAFRVGVTVYAGSRGGSQLCTYAVVVQEGLVVSGPGRLPLVRIPGAVSRAGVFRRAGPQLELACGGHQEYIPEVRVSGPAEMGVAEADDGAVPVLVSGAVPVHFRLVGSVDVVRYGVRVRAELHYPEGVACSPGTYVPFRLFLSWDRPIWRGCRRPMRPPR